MLSKSIGRMLTRARDAFGISESTSLTKSTHLRGRGGSARHRPSYLPYVKGVPGAKLAKKAAQGRLGLRQPGTPIHTR